MTREEFIRMPEYHIAQASDAYWKKNKDNEEANIMSAFEDGADWMCENLDLLWISVKEKPTKTDTYFVRTIEGCADIAFYDKDKDEWYDGKTTNGTPNYYMEIPSHPLIK